MTDWVSIGGATSLQGVNPSTTVSPTTEGNIMVFWYGEATDGEPSVPTPDGGGVTEWQVFPNNGEATDGGQLRSYIAFGLITATGSQELSLSGGVNFVSGVTQEFQPPDGALYWDMNFGSDSSDDTGPLASGNIESASPNGADRLYVGNFYTAAGSDNPCSGDSEGFTYNVVGGTGSMLGIYAYDADSSDSYSPNWSQESAGNYCDVAGFIGVTSTPPGGANQIVMIL